MTRMNWGDIVKALEMGKFDALLVMPEFRRLLGVRQLSRRHHEDVWRHTCLTIAGCQHLVDDPMVWWAAACHDLGKGTGVLRRLGLHPGHGKRGAVITRQLGKKHGLNHETTTLAWMAAQYHEELRRGHMMGPLQQVDLLMKIDAVSRPGRLTALLQVVEADIMGRDARTLRDPPDAAKEALNNTLKGLRLDAV